MVEPTEVLMLNPTKLCSICDYVFSSKGCDKRGTNFPSKDASFPYHATVAEVQNAATSKRCFICSRVWHLLLEENRLPPGVTPWIRLQASDDGFRLLISGRRPTRFFVGSSIHINRDFNPSPTFQERISQAKSWLMECTSKHINCDQGRSERIFVPSRLLDIGRSDEQWFLRAETDVRNGTDVRYVALSYKWGDYRHNLLTEYTYQAYKTGISVSEIPILFKDTAKIARLIGIRYLWIDSMCILQDSTEDWEHESTTMNDVYANSHLVIAASWATDPTCSLFPESGMGPRSGSTSLSVNWQECKTIRIVQENGWKTHLNESPLHKRGWAFQERILASRILYFTESTILWECDTARRSESFPKEGPKQYTMMEDNRHRLYTWICPEQEKQYGMKYNRMSAPLLLAWFNAIEDYSRCQLTFPSDKLVAIGGIAESFQRLSNDKYLAGLWQSQIFLCLIWHCSGKIAYEEYRAPSWSWASVDGEVFWSPICKHEIEFEGPTIYPCTLVEVHVVTNSSTGSPRGQILGGHLTISGCALICLLRQGVDFGVRLFIPNRSSCLHSRVTLEADPIYCLLLAIFLGKTGWNGYGVVLQKLLDQDLFVRVGTFEWLNDDRVDQLIKTFGLVLREGQLCVDEAVERRTFKII